MKNGQREGREIGKTEKNGGVTNGTSSRGGSSLVGDKKRELQKDAKRGFL